MTINYKAIASLPVHDRIVSVLTQYCANEETKAAKRRNGWFNPNAFALSLEALERAENEAAKLEGSFAWNDRLEAALKHNFNDRLLTAILKAL